MRLIDADALLDEMKIQLEMYTDFKMGDKEDVKEKMITYAIALSILVSGAPTIDAIRVVRCKDCKWYKDSELFPEKKMCYRHAIVRGVGKIVNGDNGYCSYAVERQGVQE